MNGHVEPLPDDGIDPVGMSLLPGSAKPRYAVLFRTHLWDEFVERQFQRLRLQVGGGDVFIVANDTSGGCEAIKWPKLLTFREDDLVQMGLPRAGTGNLVWYNVDYPLYYFANRYPGYDYYILFEYDVLTNIALDDLVEVIHEGAKDLVGATVGEPVSQWYFRSTCLELYPEQQIKKMLLPLGIFSKAAVEYLFKRRLQLAALLNVGEITTWPHCEAFITTELSLAGFAIDELENYGHTTRFSYKPAYLEVETDKLAPKSFVHPVLDLPRYVDSAFRYEWKPELFFVPWSDFHRRLIRLPVKAYIRPLSRALRLRAKKFARVVWSRFTPRVTP